MTCTEPTLMFTCLWYSHLHVKLPIGFHKNLFVYIWWCDFWSHSGLCGLDNRQTLTCNGSSHHYRNAGTAGCMVHWAWEIHCWNCRTCRLLHWQAHCTRSPPVAQRDWQCPEHICTVAWQSTKPGSRQYDLHILPTWCQSNHVPRQVANQVGQNLTCWCVHCHIVTCSLLPCHHPQKGVKGCNGKEISFCEPLGRRNMAIFLLNILSGWMNPVLTTIQTNAWMDGRCASVLVFIELCSYGGNNTQFSWLSHPKGILPLTYLKALWIRRDSFISWKNNWYVLKILFFTNIADPTTHPISWTMECCSSWQLSYSSWQINTPDHCWRIQYVIFHNIIWTIYNSYCRC